MSTEAATTAREMKASKWEGFFESLPPDAIVRHTEPSAEAVQELVRRDAQQVARDIREEMDDDGI